MMPRVHSLGVEEYVAFVKQQTEVVKSRLNFKRYRTLCQKLGIGFLIATGISLLSIFMRYKFYHLPAGILMPVSYTFAGIGLLCIMLIMYIRRRDLAICCSNADQINKMVTKPVTYATSTELEFRMVDNTAERCQERQMQRRGGECADDRGREADSSTEEPGQRPKGRYDTSPV